MKGRELARGRQAKGGKRRMCNLNTSGAPPVHLLARFRLRRVRPRRGKRLLATPGLPLAPAMGFRPVSGLASGHQGLVGSPSHAETQWHLIRLTRLPLRGQRRLGPNATRAWMHRLPVSPLGWIPSGHLKRSLCYRPGVWDSTKVDEADRAAGGGGPGPSGQVSEGSAGVRLGVSLVETPRPWQQVRPRRAGRSGRFRMAGGIGPCCPSRQSVS